MSIFDQDQSINNLLFNCETNLVNSQSIKQQHLNRIFCSCSYQPCQEINVQCTINTLTLDSSAKFLISSDNGGHATIFEVEESRTGYLKQIYKRQFCFSLLHKSQWYPVDNGLFCATYLSKIFFVDFMRLKAIDSYDFGYKNVYDSDWNVLNPNLVAVGAASSNIRFIDVRTGNCIQQITAESFSDYSHHNVTRVLWSSSDEEALFAGDSCGFIHVFDIRMPKKSLQSVENDNTACEPVVSLSHTLDQMKIISCHGTSNKATQWIFKNGRLQNANINYSNYPLMPRKKDSHVSVESLRCQTFVTDSLFFKPIYGTSGQILVYDIKSGERLNVLNSSIWSPVNKYKTNCVTGLYKDYYVLFSGIRSHLRVWGMNKNVTENKEWDKLHQDDWSD